MGASLGGIALWSNQQVIKQLSLQESQIHTEINAIVRINSLSKAAETKLLLYLTYGKASDKDEFFNLISSIDDQFDLLDTSALDKDEAINGLNDQALEFSKKGRTLVNQYQQQQNQSDGVASINYDKQMVQVHELILELQKKSTALVSQLANLISSQTINSAASNISHHSEEARLHLILYLVIHNAESKDLFLTNIKAIKENINILQERIQNQDTISLLEKISAKYLEFQQKGEELLELYGQKQNSSPDYYQENLHEFNETASWLIDAGIDLENVTVNKANEPIQNIVEQVNTSNYTVLTIVGAAFLLSILLGTWLALSLSRSINYLQSAAKKIGEGNLDVVVDLPRDDSMGVLAKTFNEMTENLQDTYTDLNSQNLALNEEIIKHKHIEKELYEQASTDPLTGTLNRRAFFDKTNEEVARCQRYFKTLSVLMLDIDHFKKVNDNFGHHSGDKALLRFAQELGKPLRTTDYIGRIGGEEFAIVLPETDMESAQKIAERIRHLVQELTIPIDQQRINFTVSIGVAEYDLKEPNINPTLERTDQALYRAKRTGRNRVCLEETLPP
jgi:diguanylate cyclase (GGDEF)-like protein